MQAGGSTTFTAIMSLLETVEDKWPDPKLAQEPEELAAFSPRERTEEVRDEAHYFNLCCHSGIR